MIQLARRQALVVIGTGMAGAKLVEEVLARAPGRFDVRMFGAEPHGTYNRILLSGVLGGTQDPSRLWLNTLEWYEQNGVFVHAGVKAEHIDTEKRTVSGAGGKVVEPYDHLVIATGSRPFVPPIPGTDLRGVFVFRTLEDCAAIGTHAQGCRRAAVLGGGLLGLEAARGLLARGVEVTVVEMAPHLMPQQLDAAGGAILKGKLEAMGLRIFLGAQSTRLLGEGTVSGVLLKDGTVITTDMVVISCGIRPNVEIARDAGLAVDRGIVVDDQLRTGAPNVYAVGECAQHRGTLYGLVDPVYEQARVLADVLTGANPAAAYTGSRPGTTLKVMGVDLTAMGEVNADGAGAEVLTHCDPARGVYKKLVARGNRLAGAILLGTPDPGGRLMRLFKSSEELALPLPELLDGHGGSGAAAAGDDPAAWPDDMQVCNCNAVPKGRIVAAIREGCCGVEAVGECTRAGTGCGSCQALIGRLITAYAAPEQMKAGAKNKVERMKEEQDGLDALPRLLDLARSDDWKGMTEDDKQRAKWHGLFFRRPTPGNFMMRLRLVAGRSDSRQFRALADIADEFGKGFCDLTTRQQVQLRWFTLAQTPEIWRRLEDVGLHSRQTGMDNVRGVCGCPAGGLTPNELFDAYDVAREYDSLIVGNKEFTNLPRKFNVTITGCLENCCHTETQDIGLVPAVRGSPPPPLSAAEGKAAEQWGEAVSGFNVLVGGKQGSGGYRPATPLDVFVTPGEAARLCAEITRLFRDHGPREQRNRARLAFLIESRGAAWFRAELERRWGRPLPRAGSDLRSSRHADHVGIHPQRAVPGEPGRSYAGLLVPVGRISSGQMRAVADLADRYGTGEVRLTVGQNVLIPNIADEHLDEFRAEPLLKELSPEPSPILRGLVTCTGNDYCHMALIDTKGWALRVARELEERTAGARLKPLTIHVSGCPAGCGLHQVGTIGLQGCRSRVNDRVVDAAHVYVNGKTGPKPAMPADVMYDVPCETLADALEPLVKHLPR